MTGSGPPLQLAKTLLCILIITLVYMLVSHVSCLSKFYPKNEKLQSYKNEINRNEINKNYTVRSVVLYNNFKDKRIIL